MKIVLSLLVFTLWSGAALAGLFKDSVSYDILVIDEQGRQIPHATVWVWGADVKRPDVRPEDLSRLVRRYAADADFVFSGRLHPHLWVLHTGAQGTIRFSQGDTEIHGFKRVRTSFAGLKRGYQPVQVDDDAANNSRRKIVLKLRQDSAADVDPGMEELDLIRALADPGNDEEDPMSGDRDRRLQDANRRLRELAARLEKDGRADDAAAVYYNLAFLPSVDFGRNSAGAPVVVGYTNGFDDRNPQRVADRRRARSLGRNHPVLEFETLFESYESRNVLELGLAANSPLRRAYAADIERLIQLRGERLWPRVYAPLEAMYSTERQFAEGCGALRRWHEFEPTYYDTAGWARQLGRFQAGVRMDGGPPDLRCEIPGVPAPAAR